MSCKLLSTWYKNLVKDKINKKCFVTSLDEISPAVHPRISSMFYCYYISPWERAWLFIWSTLNDLYPRMLCAKFLCNRPSGSGDEHFSNFIHVFLLFHNLLPLYKDIIHALHLTKNEYPNSPNDVLCQVWLKLTQLFWISKRILKCQWSFSIYPRYIWTSLNPLYLYPFDALCQTSIPFTQGCFVLSLVDIGPVVLETIM